MARLAVHDNYILDWRIPGQDARAQVFSGVQGIWQAANAARRMAWDLRDEPRPFCATLTHSPSGTVVLDIAAGLDLVARCSECLGSWCQDKSGHLPADVWAHPTGPGVARPGFWPDGGA